MTRNAPPLSSPSPRNVIVTGASRGLGRALFLELVARGDRVLGVARDRAALDRVVADAGAPDRAFGLSLDVAEKTSPHTIAVVAGDLLGDVDVVVNNASTLGPVPLPLLADTACEDLAAVLETNLVAPFRLAKALVGGMVARGRGDLVHVSSDAAVGAYARWGAYGASKAALDHLARIWAEELRGSGVRVLAVDPGEMDTKMHADAMPDADRTALARPEHVAQAVADWLARRDVETGSRFVASEVAS